MKNLFKGNRNIKKSRKDEIVKIRKDEIVECPNLTVRGNICFGDSPEAEVSSLPANLTVCGNIRLGDSQQTVSVLPDGQTVPVRTVFL